MLSVESAIKELQQKNVQVFAICCDNIDSIHAWATAVGGLPFPVLSDFWPHGKMSQEYGVLNEDGVPDRTLILIDKDGIIRYIDELLTEDVPTIQPILEICEKMDA